MSMFPHQHVSSSALMHSIKEAMCAAEQLSTPQAITFLQQATKQIAHTFSQGKKLLIAGNGGSLCDAMHFAEELTGIFRTPRKALPAIALSDPGHLTCVANDVHFDTVFARAIEALGQPGDVFVGLTTSGNSANLVRAFATAKQYGLHTIAFLGRGGGKLKGVADLEWIVESLFKTSDRIQEVQMAAIHILIEQVEYALFPHLCANKVTEEPEVAGRSFV
jgi:D-sedoheptulose 7-phosphate isomerase